MIVFYAKFVIQLRIDNNDNRVYINIPRNYAFIWKKAETQNINNQIEVDNFKYVCVVKV